MTYGRRILDLLSVCDALLQVLIHSLFGVLRIFKMNVDFVQLFGMREKID